ncbi:hypothetical protein HF563_09525 [Acidithiobacillus ferridurans]|nr:hypothetical protein [Acidithiobacillus ferridurans]
MTETSAGCSPHVGCNPNAVCSPIVETTTPFALRMSAHEFAALDRICAVTELSRAKIIRHLILSQVDPLNDAPDILLELRKIGMRLKRACDDSDYSLAPRQELETLYKFILGTAYRLADLLEPWEDD